MYTTWTHHVIASDSRLIRAKDPDKGAVNRICRRFSVHDHHVYTTFPSNPLGQRHRPSSTGKLPQILKFSPILIPTQLIQQAYTPQANLSSEDQKRLQQELFGIQKRPEAWGLVVPFLNHPDPNVQFFGAHTAQVKIARDW